MFYEAFLMFLILTWIIQLSNLWKIIYLKKRPGSTEMHRTERFILSH